MTWFDHQCFPFRSKKIRS